MADKPSLTTTEEKLASIVSAQSKMISMLITNRRLFAACLIADVSASKSVRERAEKLLSSTNDDLIPTVDAFVQGYCDELPHIFRASDDSFEDEEDEEDEPAPPFDSASQAYRDEVSYIVSKMPSDEHLRTKGADRMFKILSWLPRVVDFTHRTVSIDARLRVLVPTHKDEKGADVYQSLVFNTSLFDPKTKSPVIEYPIGGDLLSSDGPIYLANSWNPKLSPDMPVEVEVTLNIGFDFFDVPDAPVAEAPEFHSEYDEVAPKPAWEPKVGDWVTITKPEDTKKEPGWVGEMDKYLGKARQIASVRSQTGFFHLWLPADHDDCRQGRSLWTFHKDWMTPAEAPAEAKAEDIKSPLEQTVGEKITIETDGWVFKGFATKVAASSWQSGITTAVDFTFSPTSCEPKKKQEPEAPAEAPKPGKRQITHADLGKRVVVTHRKDGYESSYSRYLTSITVRPSRPDRVEYGVKRSREFDDFHSDILVVYPDDPNSEYQVELANG